MHVQGFTTSVSIPACIVPDASFHVVCKELLSQDYSVTSLSMTHIRRVGLGLHLADKDFIQGNGRETGIPR